MAVQRAALIVEGAVANNAEWLSVERYIDHKLKACSMAIARNQTVVIGVDEIAADIGARPSENTIVKVITEYRRSGWDVVRQTERNEDVLRFS